jgi:hypothetical protein
LGFWKYFDVLSIRWQNQYNKQRPHEALGGLLPAIQTQQKLESSSLNCLLDREA